jgi:hypothetical protein
MIGHSLVARKRIPHRLFLDCAGDWKPPIDRNNSATIAAALAAGSRVVLSTQKIELDKVTGEGRASLARKQQRPGSKTDWEASRTRLGDPDIVDQMCHLRQTVPGLLSSTPAEETLRFISRSIITGRRRDTRNLAPPV